MRIEAILWTGTAIFFAALATIYLAVGGDAAGSSLLLIAVAFGALVGAWLWNWTRRHPPRAEDRSDADMADEAGELGIFVTNSWRPIALAAGATIAMLGLAIGPWLTLIGLGMIVFHTIGLVTDLR